MTPDAPMAASRSHRPVATSDVDIAGLQQSLVEGLASLSLHATSAQLAGLLTFLALLKKWNRVYNLTAIRDARDMMVVHLLDSLSVLPFIDRLAPTTVVDVGSGAGLPAIPLAIMRPALPIMSVDAVAKKIGFQLQVKAALGLVRLSPVHARIESLHVDPAPSLIVARAYAPLAAMVRSVDRLSGTATTVLAMKGNAPIDEIAALPPSWTAGEIVPLDVPSLGAARCIVVLRRVVA